jgi:hypothetical protein
MQSPSMTEARHDPAIPFYCRSCDAGGIHCSGTDDDIHDDDISSVERLKLIGAGRWTDRDVCADASDAIGTRRNSGAPGVKQWRRFKHRRNSGVQLVRAELAAVFA